MTTRGIGTGLVVDVGGTFLRAGIYHPRSGLLKRDTLRIPSPNFRRSGLKGVRLQRQLVDAVADCARRLQKSAPLIRWVGVSICGPTRANGVVLSAPPLWGDTVRAFPLRAALKRRLRRPVAVFNDLTCAASAVAAMARYRKHRRVLVITVSTGVGSKMADTRTGEILRNPDGLSGELGHARIDFTREALRCDCGGKGHVSAYSSGRGVVRVAKLLAPKRRPLSAEEIARLARQGGRFALHALDVSMTPLARALCVLAGSIAMDRIVLIGGFALGVGELYRRRLAIKMTAAGMFGWSGKQVLSLVELGPDDDSLSLRGAGLLSSSELSGRR
ncbi:MAG: ROK family protein [Elusimicrobiota bacterium]